MSYHIAYEPQLCSRYPPKQSRKQKRKVRFFLMLLFLFVAIFAAIEFELVSYLIPGEPEITVHAAAVMVDHIRAGTPVVEAVHCFMETVVEGGK